LAALTAIVLLHLALSVAHGAAHAAGDVRLSVGAGAFVLVVIEAAPLAGLLWMRRRRAAGASVVAVAMTTALVFGVVNHFVLPGADRIDHVTPPVRGWFEWTAALLAATEAAGAVFATLPIRSRE